MNFLRSDKFNNFLRKYLLILMMVAIGLFMSFTNKNYLTVNNGINILRNVAMQGVLGCAMTMMLVSGNIDLSFGSTIGFTGVLIGYMSKWLMAGGMNENLAAVLSILTTFVCAVIFGAINAYFVSRWNMPAMMVTVATQFGILGISGIISKGYPTNQFPSWYTFFGKDRVGQIPISVIICLLFFLIFYVLLNHTKFGRTMYAVGGNQEAARLSGIQTKKYIYAAYIVMQLAAVVAGIILSSQLLQGSHAYGSSVAFNVIAAVIIGGSGMSGGTGNMRGTIIGLLFLGVIMNALTILNASEYVQYVVRGVLIMFAMWLSQVQEIRAARSK